jgi:hypothetical protein
MTDNAPIPVVLPPRNQRPRATRVIIHDHKNKYVTSLTVTGREPEDVVADIRGLYAVPQPQSRKRRRKSA